MEAPGSTSPYSPGQFEADLARINVLRLRGEYDAARQLCREVLSKKPESEQAHALMGDILLEAGDLRQSADWFELALSHAPDSKALQRKAAAARQRVEEHEALETAQRLGIPTSKGKMQLFAGTLLVLIAGVVIVAFILGGQVSGGGKLSAIRDPLDLSAPPVAETQPSQNLPTAVGFQLPASDDRLLQNLRQVDGLGDRVLLAVLDPRGPTLLVSLEAPTGEFTKKELARDAAIILKSDAQAQAVSLRYLRGGEPLAMADLTRSALGNLAPDAPELGAALTNVWPQIEPQSTQSAPASGPISPSRETIAPAGESEPIPARSETAGAH